MAVMKRKKLKKKVKPVSPVRRRQVSEGGSFPPFQMTEMKKTTKKKPQKMKVDQFGE